MKKTLLCLAFTLSAAAHAAEVADVSRARRIDVSGVGIATATADTAVVSVTCEAAGKKSLDAQKQAEAKTAAVLEALKRAKVAPFDARTVSYQVMPQMSYQDGKPPKLEGYRVSSSLEVKVRALAELGRVLDAALEAGADQVQTTSFEVSKKDAVESRARERAVADAKRKAAEIAAGLGVKLGPPLAVSETFQEHFPPPAAFGGFRSLAAKSADAGFPVSPGETEISVRLIASFGIE